MARAAAFDSHHPPAADLLAECVHCGFCLPTCPTYRLWGDEMDSPRGRIYLMKLGMEGEVGLDPTVVGHFDACLGCMACVTSCPSGVRYDRLIEAVRSQVERNTERSRAERRFRKMVFRLFPHPARLRVAAVFAWAYQRLRLGWLLRRSGLFGRLPSGLRALEELLPRVALGDLGRRLPDSVSATGESRLRVGMVSGCVQSVFFSEVNRATARVLAAEGCDVVIPRGQGCCGALMVHAGEEASALDLARRMIATFEEVEVDRIVINAAGCGSTLKEYGHMLRDDPGWADRAASFSTRVRDISELLDELPARAERHPIAARVVYHDACHLGHAQGVRAQPRRLLRSIPGLTLVDAGEAEICCGSAGIYNLVRTEAAEELGRRKAAQLLATDPDLIASANPGCMLQIQRHLSGQAGPIPILHPVQIVDASIRGIELLPRAVR
jgi:glycolate oxidase iron-sulfur subunit